MIDKDTILALLLCECRILYKNQEMVTWVEEQFKLFFKETHTELSARTSHSELKQAIEDLFSMVTLEWSEIPTTFTVKELISSYSSLGSRRFRPTPDLALAQALATAIVTVSDRCCIRFNLEIN